MTGRGERYERRRRRMNHVRAAAYCCVAGGVDPQRRDYGRLDCSACNLDVNLCLCSCLCVWMCVCFGDRSSKGKVRRSGNLVSRGKTIFSIFSNKSVNVQCSRVLCCSQDTFRPSKHPRMPCADANGWQATRARQILPGCAPAGAAHPPRASSSSFTASALNKPSSSCCCSSSS